MKESYFIIYSTDRGETWSYNPARENRFKYRFIFFRDRDNGWAVRSGQVKPNSSTYKNVIIHTTDRGRTWATQLDTLPGEEARLTGLDFVDSLNGIAWADYSWRLWNTTNGGQSWQKMDSYWYTNLSATFKDMKKITPDTWLGVTGFYTDIYRYSRTSGMFINDPRLHDVRLEINPNVINTSEDISISLEAQRNCQARFEVVNSLGDVVDYSDPFQLLEGMNKLSFNTKGIRVSGPYWLKASIDGQEVSIKPFVVIR
jgi:hypothetical protein